MKVPERLAWAVETLSVGPSDRLLEIGCGRGVAIALVSELLTTGSIVALDRSATATSAAAERNAAGVASGKVVVQTASLADAKVATSGASFCIVARPTPRALVRG